MALGPVARRLLERRTVVRYGAISILSFALNLGLSSFLHEVVHLDPRIAVAVAFVFVFVVNFLFSRHYIFEAAEESARTQFAHYVASSVAFRGLEYCGFLALHGWLDLQYQVALVAVLGTSVVVKFVYYRLAVFSGRG